jgi:hypothetical protein
MDLRCTEINGELCVVEVPILQDPTEFAGKQRLEAWKGSKVGHGVKA